MKLLILFFLSFMFLQNASAASSCKRILSTAQSKYMFTSVEASDHEDLSAILADPRSVKMSGDNHTRLTVQMMIETSSTLGRTVKYASSYILAYRDLKTNQVIGFVSVYDFNGRGRASFGYAIHPSLWGQGLATEMTTDFLDYAAKDLHLSYLEASALQTNIPSNQVLIKLGFRKTGEVQFSVAQRDNTYARELSRE